MKRFKNWPVFGLCLLTVIVGVACAVEMVTHPAFALRGTTFRAVVTLQGTESGLSNHIVCVGLNDPQAKGWTATPQGWSTTQGTSTPSSGGPGDAAEDAASATDYNSSYPAFAPFRCWWKAIDFTTKDNRVTANFDISVPEDATKGPHQLMWIYNNNNSRFASKTTSIDIVIDRAAVQVVEEPAGANCPTGGKAIINGLDTDRDGVPDLSVTTNYVCNGSDGNDGTDGFNALVNVDAEPAGDNCAQGGQRIETGLDNAAEGGVARNGVLEAGEVTETSYVCTGANGEDGEDGKDGEDGFNALVNVVAEPEGSNCAQGGQKIETGLDNAAEGGVARNGVLEAGEVTSVAYVCNGKAGTDGANGNDGNNGTNGTNGNDGINGFSGLVSVVAEPAGSNCVAGGQRIVTGLDDGKNDGVASNRKLEEGEIENTTYVCNAAVPADSGCSTTGGLTLPFAILLLAGVFFRRSARVAS